MIVFKLGDRSFVASFARAITYLLISLLSRDMLLIRYDLTKVQRLSGLFELSSGMLLEEFKHIPLCLFVWQGKYPSASTAMGLQTSLYSVTRGVGGVTNGTSAAVDATFEEFKHGGILTPFAAVIHVRLQA